MLDERGAIKLRDVIIVFLVIGFASTAMFSIVGGWQTAYNVTTNETFDETTLQVSDELNSTIYNLENELDEASNVFSQTFILLFTGFKVIGLSVVTAFASARALIWGLGEFLHISGTYLSYIILIVVVTVAFTIWRSLQGRDQV